jgi:hypothetical protein
MPFRLNTSRAILSASFRKFLASAAACSVSRSDSIAAPFGNTGSGVLDDSSIHVSASPPAAYRPWWACAMSRLSLCTTPPLAARSFDNQDLIWPCSMGCLWFHECRAFPSPRPPARHEGAPVVASAGALFLGLADHSGMMSPDGPTRR